MFALIIGLIVSEALFIALGWAYATFWFTSGLLGTVAVLWILGTRRLSRMPDAGAPAQSADKAAQPVSQRAILRGALVAILTCVFVAYVVKVSFVTDEVESTVPTYPIRVCPRSRR